MIECNVAAYSKDVLDTSKRLLKSLKKLRKARSMCGKCDLLGKCSVWKEFNTSITDAISEYIEEWGIKV